MDAGAAGPLCSSSWVTDFSWSTLAACLLRLNAKEAYICWTNALETGASVLLFFALGTSDAVPHWLIAEDIDCVHRQACLACSLRHGVSFSSRLHIISVSLSSLSSITSLFDFMASDVASRNDGGDSDGGLGLASYSHKGGGSDGGLGLVSSNHKGGRSDGGTGLLHDGRGG